MITMATVPPGLLKAAIEDMSRDDGKWRPVDDATATRIRSYVQADIDAGRSTFTSITEYDDLTEPE